MTIEARLTEFVERPRADGITKRIREYIELENLTADYAALGKEISAQVKACEERVIEAFVDEGADDQTVDGRRWKPEFKTIVSPATGQTDSLVRYISEHGGEDLIQPSMHHSRRDAWLREKCIDDQTGEVKIPEDMRDLVQTFDKVVLTKRKL